MQRSNRSVIRRNKGNPFILVIVICLIAAVAFLTFWFFRGKDKTPLSKKVEHKELVQKQSIVKQRKSPTQTPIIKKNLNEKPLKALSVKIKGPLSHSIRSKTDRKKATFLAALAARLIIWKLDLRRELRRGDSMKILYRPIKEQSLYQIEALHYKSLRYKTTFHFYRFHPEGKRFAVYYDSKGKTIESHLRNSPLHTYDQVTSILKMRPKHKGVDFKTPVGTKVYLPWRAKILRKNWNLRYNGYCLKIRFLNRRYKRRSVHGLFLHLKEGSIRVKVGAIVPAGSVVALSGNTGRSTAPHLHYQLETSRRRIIDPFLYHKTYKRNLASHYRAAFEARCLYLDNRLKSLTSD